MPSGDIYETHSYFTFLSSYFPCLSTYLANNQWRFIGHMCMCYWNIYTHTYTRIYIHIFFQQFGMHYIYTIHIYTYIFFSSALFKIRKVIKKRWKSWKRLLRWHQGMLRQLNLFFSNQITLLSWIPLMHIVMCVYIRQKKILFIRVGKMTIQNEGEKIMPLKICI